MKKVLTGALAALILAGATAATVTPAAAQPFRGYHGGWGGYHGGYRGWGPGVAVGAGLVGLAVGASLAADHPYHGYGYGYGYGPAPYYGSGYYGCRTHLRWNPYWGEYERVRACY